jgi:hypothetical protein
MVSHCLEREELANALDSGGGRSVQLLGPQFCVGVLLGRRGDNPFGVLVV